jgi:DNA polymerase-3 subunit delta'
MLYPWQSQQWHIFSQQYQQQRLPHAVLLTGDDGLGQLALANNMVAAVLCEKAPTESPCGHCHNCQLFSAGNHPDHSFVAPDEVGKQIKIEQIRDLKQKQTLTANVAKWKTAIIAPAENMNISASNSLLKLLEEPQGNTLLILISAKVQQLPITIMSRCQKIAFSRPTAEQATAWLGEQGEYQQQDIERALLLANGAPLAALELLSSHSLDYLEQAAKDFSALLKGTANPVLLAQQWQQYDLNLVLHYLQIRIKQRLITRLEQNGLGFQDRNWMLHDCIINTLKLLSSSYNLNKVLLIEQFMVSAMDLANIKNTASNRSI